MQGACPQRSCALGALMKHATFVANVHEAQSEHTHALQHVSGKTIAEDVHGTTSRASCSSGMQNGEIYETAVGLCVSVQACMPSDCDNCPIQRNVRVISGALGVSAAESHETGFVNASGACIPGSATLSDTPLSENGHNGNHTATKKGATRVQARNECMNEACAPCNTRTLNESGADVCVHQYAVAQKRQTSGQNCAELKLDVHSLSKQGSTSHVNSHHEHLVRSSQPTTTNGPQLSSTLGCAPYPVERQSSAVYGPHACGSLLFIAESKPGGYASSATAGVPHACRPCMLCGCRDVTSDGVDSSCTSDGGMHGRYVAWAPCMLCGARKRPLLLGESAEVTQEMHDALERVLDVHTSDSLMHFEFLGPFWELTEVWHLSITFVCSVGNICMSSESIQLCTHMLSCVASIALHSTRTILCLYSEDSAGCFRPTQYFCRSNRLC